MSAAVKEKDGFTFIWKVENALPFMMFHNPTVESPKFTVRSLDNTEWYLTIRLESSSSCGAVQRYFDSHLGRSDDGTHKVTIGYTISIFDADGSLKSLKTSIDTVSKKEFSCRGKFLKKDIETDKDLYPRKDTYTVRCRIWSCTVPVPSTQCFARTIVESQRKTFTVSLNPFSAYKLEQRILIPVPSAARDAHKLDLTIYTTKDEAPKDFLRFEISQTDKNATAFKNFGGRISLLDCHGKPKDIKQEDLRTFKKSWEFEPFITMSKVAAEKELYLPNDCLSVECDFRTYGDIKYSQIEETVFSSNLSKQEERLKDDLKSLYLERKYCDVILLAEGKTFEAHKGILSARSQVFDDLFQSEMKGKNSCTVEIADVDADTLDRLLMFMYCQTVEDLQIENVEKLYFAATKYDIPMLKEKCSELMKSKVPTEHLPGTLALVEVHSVTDLETVTQELVNVQLN